MDTIRQSEHSRDTDERLLDLLHNKGPLTLENLCSLAGVSWPQGFLAIDRLSRSGAVSLRQARRGEYRVSPGKAAA